MELTPKQTVNFLINQYAPMCKSLKCPIDTLPPDICAGFAVMYYEEPRKRKELLAYMKEVVAVVAKG